MKNSSQLQLQFIVSSRSYLRNDGFSCPLCLPWLRSRYPRGVAHHVQIESQAGESSEFSTAALYAAPCVPGCQEGAEATNAVSLFDGASANCPRRARDRFPGHVDAEGLCWHRDRGECSC